MYAYFYILFFLKLIDWKQKSNFNFFRRLMDSCLFACTSSKAKTIQQPFLKKLPIHKILICFQYLDWYLSRNKLHKLEFAIFNTSKFNHNIWCWLQEASNLSIAIQSISNLKQTIKQCFNRKPKHFKDALWRLLINVRQIIQPDPLLSPKKSINQLINLRFCFFMYLKKSKRCKLSSIHCLSDNFAVVQVYIANTVKLLPCKLIFICILLHPNV